MIIKNCDKDKNYDITLYKFSQALIKHGNLKYLVEKYILQNISDIDNIDKFFLLKTKLTLRSYLKINTNTKALQILEGMQYVVKLPIGPQLRCIP